jgi:hypothetical protein
MTMSAFLRLGAGFGLMIFLAACEIEVGDKASPSDSGGDSTPTPGTDIPTPGGGTGGGGGVKPDPGDETKPPAVPGAQSPGSGESFSGAGAKVTFAWTDAEGAVEFELLVQGFGSGGWQTAVHQTTDNFQHTYTLNNTAWTQYRWAVRSIAADSQTSAFTAWRSFTWDP